MQLSDDDQEIDRHAVAKKLSQCKTKNVLRNEKKNSEQWHKSEIISCRYSVDITIFELNKITKIRIVWSAIMRRKRSNGTNGWVANETKIMHINK